jgi:hypothetical protein
LSCTSLQGQVEARIAMAASAATGEGGGIVPRLTKSDIERALLSGAAVPWVDTGGKPASIQVDPPPFIQLGLESRVEFGAGAPAEQRAIGVARRGCGADRPLR